MTAVQAAINHLNEVSQKKIQEKNPVQNTNIKSESKKGNFWALVGVLGGITFIIYGIPMIQEYRKKSANEQRLLKTQSNRVEIAQ